MGVFHYNNVEYKVNFNVPFKEERKKNEFWIKNKVKNNLENNYIIF